MIIYPDIELMDGKCVNVARGRHEEPFVFHVDPIKTALDFQEAGAEWLHVVDYDGVYEGGRHNAELICDIIKAVEIPVQVGGGIRTTASVEWWFEHGAARLVLGTAAVKDRNFVKAVCTHYPNQIVIAIDSRGGHVVVEGWQEETIYTPLEVAADFQESGAAAIIYTDIDRSDDLPEGAFAGTTDLACSLSIPVISSGTVQSLDDIARLNNLPNIAGAVVGRALFRKTFGLDEAIAVASQKPTRAEFVQTL